MHFTDAILNIEPADHPETAIEAPAVRFDDKLREEILAENITIAPVWMDVQAGTTARFTLIFAPLPKTCDSFNLFEDIPQSGGFHIRNIRRNTSDIYRVFIA